MTVIPGAILLGETYDFACRYGVAHDHRLDDRHGRHVSLEGDRVTRTHDHMHEEMRGGQIAIDRLSGLPEVHAPRRHTLAIRRLQGHEPVDGPNRSDGGSEHWPNRDSDPVCFPLTEFTLCSALFLIFAFGSAIALMVVGAAAALGMRQATTRLLWFRRCARRAFLILEPPEHRGPLYVGYHGGTGLALQPMLVSSRHSRRMADILERRNSAESSC